MKRHIDTINGIAILVFFLFISIFCINKYSNPNLTIQSQLAQVGSSLSSGLVLHYKFDEGTGTTVSDSSGSNSGSLQGGATWNTGKVGTGAVQFDGVNDNLQGATSGFVASSGSVSFWVKSDRQNSVDQYILSHRSPSGDSRLYLLIPANTSDLIINIGNTLSIDSGVDILVGEWHHVILTWANGSYKLYFDSVLAKNGGFTGMNSISSCFNIGKFGGPSCTTNANYLFGSIDDFRVYNRDITQQEAIDLYSLGSSVSTPNPINGQCSLSLNQCTSGSFGDINDSPTKNLWSCIGSGGGTTDSCSLDIVSTTTNPSQNNKPVAVSQSISVNQNTSKQIVLNGTDLDGNQLTYSIVINPTNGTLVRESGDTTGTKYIYTPNTSYIGNDLFTFKVNDGQIDSDISNINISVIAVANSAPIVATIRHDAVDNDSNKTGIQIDPNSKINMSSSATDADNDQLSWSWNYKLNNASEIQTSNGTGAISNQYFDYSGKSGTFEWILRVSDGKVTTEQKVTFEIEAPVVVNPIGGNWGYSDFDSKSITLMAAATNITNQLNWRYYNAVDAPEGAYLGTMLIGTNNLTANIKLPKTLSPGRYYIFLKCITYNGKLSDTTQLSIGGGSTAQFPVSNGWSNKMPIDVITSSDTLTLSVNKGPINSNMFHSYLLRGIYITKDDRETVDNQDRVINLVYPTVMDDSSPQKGNLMINGGMEVGDITNIWGFAANKKVDSSVLWDNTQGYSGNGSLKIPIGPSTAFSDIRNTALYSRIYHLKPNKKYTISLWAKTSPGKTTGLRLWMKNSYEPSGGMTRQPDIIKLLTVTDRWQKLSVSGYALDYPTSDYNFILTNSSDVNDYIWIDNVQLEEGDETPFQPSASVEAGISISKTSNIYYIDDMLVADLYVKNNLTTPISKKVYLEYYDHLNKTVKRDTLNVSLESQETKKMSIDLPSKLGAFRIMYWVDNERNSDREIAYSVINRPISVDADSYLGIHPNYIDLQFESLQRLGIKWLRTLSIADFFQWDKVEVQEGNFKYYDSELSVAQNYGLNTMGTIGYGWPSWADAGGVPDIAKWKKFVGQMASHYRNKVRYWEIWNEPNGLFSASVYADLLKAASDAIKEQDSTLKVVAMGGVQLDYMNSVIREIETKYPGWDWKKNLDILSTHAYPGGATDVFKSNIIDKYSVPVWNTETGYFDRGFYQGHGSNFIVWGKSLIPYLDARRFYIGSYNSVNMVIENFTSSIAGGMTKYFYYDSRYGVDPSLKKTHTTIFEGDGTIRPKGVAYSISGSILDYSIGMGNVSQISNVSMLLFDKPDGAIAVLFSKDKKPRQISLNLGTSQFVAMDVMGNALPSSSRVRFGRFPVYIKTNGISSTNLKSALQSSSVVTRVDIDPPGLSFSEVPKGTVTDGSFRVRWIAMDADSLPNLGEINPESGVASDVPNPDAIMYSYRLSGYSSWSSWSSKVYEDYLNVPIGNYVMEVKAKDEAGNISNISRNITVSQSSVINTPQGVAGVCSSTLNQCTSGTFSDVADTTTNNLWSCNGSGGGTNASCSLAIQPVADTIPPTVSITSPSDGSIIKDSVPISAIANDNIQVKSVQFKLDGVNFGNAFTQSPYSGTWNTVGVSNGNHVLTAVATDMSDNITVSSPINVNITNVIVTIDKIAPVISGVGSPSITAGETTITFTTDEPTTAQIEYGLTDSYGNTTSINRNLVTSHSVTIFGLNPNTTYHYRVITRDASGNASVSDDKTFTTKVLVTVDTDNDGVVDSSDMCPNTPKALIFVVNRYGCPKPKVDNFDIKPNFDYDILYYSDFVIGKNQYGKIDFKQPVQLVKDSSSYKDRLDIDSSLVFSQNKVTLNSANLPQLNKKAVITLNNVNVIKPKILKDGVLCTTCTIISFINRVLVFNVSGFSTYEVVEGGANYVPNIAPNIVYTPVKAGLGTITPTVTQNVKTNTVKTNTTTTKKNPPLNIFNTTTTKSSSTTSDIINNYIFNDNSDYFKFEPLEYSALFKKYILSILNIIAEFIKSVPVNVNSGVNKII